MKLTKTTKNIKKIHCSRCMNNGSCSNTRILICYLLKNNNLGITNDMYIEAILQDELNNQIK